MLATIFLAAALITPANATPQNLDCGTILMPPPGQYQADARYWEPDPIIRLINYWDMDGFCRTHNGLERGRYEACHFGITDAIPNGPDVTHGRQVCYLIHEEAHRHGWPENHPGAIYWRGK